MKFNWTIGPAQLGVQLSGKVNASSCLFPVAAQRNSRHHFFLGSSTESFKFFFHLKSYGSTGSYDFASFCSVNFSIKI